MAVIGTYTYRVSAIRSYGMWELHIPGVGVTQTDKASAAEEMVRDYLDCLGAEAADEAAIAIEWHLGEAIDQRITDARALAAEVGRIRTEAALAAREVVALLKAEGLPGRDIAIILGLSEQRISQLSKK